MTERAQRIIVWWALAFMTIFGITWWGLLKMMPPPDANLTEAQVAAFYVENGFHIKLGAMIAGWVSAYMVPFSAVVSIQMARLEKGKIPVWSILAFAGGITMSMFLVFPPICWGVAAFTAERAPEVTMLMHELSLLTLTTTDQYYLFQMIPLGIISLSIKQHDELSAFPRWLGYIVLWAALAFAVGPLAFLFKTGPFSWNGLLVFWSPLVLTGVWVPATCYCMLKALKHQEAANA